MDSFDRILIGELSANCRISFTDLAQKYDVSVNTIKKRVEKLVQENVIVAFDVQIPLEILHANFAVIYLELADGGDKERIRELGNHPNIYAIAFGFQSEVMVILTYRNNAELTSVIDYIRSERSIANQRIVPLLPPLAYKATQATKGLDDLKKIDWKIIHTLQKNGRMQLSDLSRIVKASVPSVRKRLTYLRENGMISETLLINPGAVSYGMVIIFNVRFQEISENVQIHTDRTLSEAFPENYWLSWRIADSPELLLVFQSPNAKDITYLHDQILQLISGTEIMQQMILGEWEYFPDFRNEIIESHLK